MKKYISRAMILLMVGTLAFGSVACSNTTKEEAVVEATTEAVQNTATLDIETVSPEDFMNKVGFELPVPEGAENVSCSILHFEDGDIAEIEFELDGKQFCLRAKQTMVCEMDENKEGEEAGDLCRINATWKPIEKVEVQERKGLAHVADVAEGIEAPGYISWIDIVPGVMYNLSMVDTESVDELVKYADQVFVPYDGETEADEVLEDVGEMDEEDGLALIQEIYDTKAGTPGSDERVQAAADDFITYAQKHEEEMTLEFACETVKPALETVRGDMDAETFKADFQECVDAVKDAVANKDAAMVENDSYKCMVRAMEIELGDMK